MPDTLELISLPGRGRAECLRMMLVASQTPFLDHRINLTQWKEFRRREQLPDDTKLPLLRVNGKRTIVGGRQIGRFIAERVDLLGSSAQDASDIEDIVATVESLEPNLAPVIRATLTKNFVARKDAWSEFKEKSLLPVIAELTKKLDGKAHFVGDRLSWADIAVAEAMSRFAHCFEANFIHGHPILKQHMMAVEREPGLARYVSERPMAQF
uniref:Glutathione S-transferase n=1 Tax=Panagrellus redivivus TaxID=6233 RepID=A0A7E4ZU25_PANRE